MEPGNPLMDAYLSGLEQRLRGSTSLATLSVDFPVNVKPAKTVELYELTDNIVLRNSTRS